MHDPVMMQPLLFERFARLRELVDLIARLRDVEPPISSPDGLRQIVDVVSRLAELVGVDTAWIGRLRTVLDEPSTLRLVSAVVEFALHNFGRKAEGGAIRVTVAGGDEVHLTAHALVDWLPIVLEIINLLRRIRQDA